jgi:hypothetical protein
MKLKLLAILLFGSFTLFAQNVTIPDANFKGYLVGNLAINTNGDTEIQVSEANVFTGSINCAGLGINDLTGIEAFTEITILQAFSNNITAIDLSSNTKIEQLLLESNNITGNADFSMLTVMNDFKIHSNTNLTTLNVANGNNTNFIRYESQGCSSLTCIQVDDVAYSNLNWSNVDPASTFSANCGVDTSPPVANCSNITVTLDANGDASIVAADIDNGSTDNVGITAYAIDIAAFDCTDVGANTVTLTVTDAAGNQNNCSATVTVVDATIPVMSCTSAFTVQLDSNGNASITAADIDNGSTDACGIASLSIDTASFDCNSIGANTVTLTATDNNGNTNTCTTTVTVQDMVNPVASAMDITVTLDATGNASIVGSDVNNGSSDACGIDTITVTPSIFDCSQVGTPVTVTMTVTDNNGNTATDTSIVTVEDTTGVTVISGPINVFTGTGPNDGNCETVVNYGVITMNDFVINDNCGTATTTTVSQTGGLGTGAFFPVGTTMEEYTLTDNNGNTTVYIFEVTITDTTLPQIACPSDLIVSGDSNGDYTVLDYTALPTDNCSSGSDLVVVQNPAPGTIVSGPTVNTISLTATDASGNTTSCSFNLTVDGTLSIQENDAFSFSIYPNPTAGSLHLNTVETVEEIRIFSLSGAEVLHTTTKSIDVSQLATGVYLIKIRTENGAEAVQRFLKN